MQPHGLQQLRGDQVRLFETPSRGPRQGTTNTMVSDSGAHSAFRFLKLTVRHSDSELYCYCYCYLFFFFGFPFPYFWNVFYVMQSGLWVMSIYGVMLLIFVRLEFCILAVS